MRETRRPLERDGRPLEPSVPAVCARQRTSGLRFGGCKGGEGADALAVARRRLECPRERRERAAPRPALDVVGCVEPAYFVPERACLAGGTVVSGRLADEVEPPRRPRAYGVEEVAVAGDRVGAEEPAAARGALELGLPLLVEERGGRGAARKPSLLDPQDEDDLETSRARSEEVEDGHPARFSCASEANGSVEQPHDLLACEVAAEVAPAVELSGGACHALVGAQVESSLLAGRRVLQAVGRADHRACEFGHGGDGILRRAGRLEMRYRPPAKVL